MIVATLPTNFFFRKGTGIHEKQMRSFEETLSNAGFHSRYFIKTTSIIPPGMPIDSGRRWHKTSSTPSDHNCR